MANIPQLSAHGGIITRPPKGLVLWSDVLHRNSLTFKYLPILFSNIIVGMGTFE
jgi:hypothetical protein